jgi:hypothetical protein
MNCGIVCKKFMLLLVWMSIKGCMDECQRLDACLLKLQLFWRQKEGGPIFEFFVDTTQKLSLYTYPILKWCILQFINNNNTFLTCMC